MILRNATRGELVTHTPVRRKKIDFDTGIQSPRGECATNINLYRNTQKTTVLGLKIFLP